mmetsp:Transcript_28505/g.73209  ORF Transcript_28505/g.73209 Transcript_28505/m.73209 type:complete len:231 (-) Transcript_28505:104-796(-)
MEDLHNYKGWYSILVVAMFVVAEVGRPGRMSDSTATQLSSFYQGMFEDKEGWLGPGGLLISNGACGLCDFVMVPYPVWTMTDKQRWSNFCFSSTRMFVEQVFGMWKSRWQVCNKEQECSHLMMMLMTYSTMILHNMWMYYRNTPEWDCGDDYMEDAAPDLAAFMEKMSRCKHCKEHGAVHYVHLNRSWVNACSSGAAAMAQRREEIADRLWIPKCQAAAGYNPNSYDKLQ